MKKIKVAQIGLGHDHAVPIFDSILSQPEIFDVLAFAVPPVEEIEFCDKVHIYRNERRIPMMKIDEVLNLPELDGVIIETEERNLTKYAIMAVEKNLHIHMDKPGGTDLDEFEKLINMVKNKNLTFSVGYMYRFNPVVLKSLERIKNGEIGEVYSVEAHMDCEHSSQKRQWLQKFPGGMMFYLGCHLVDLIYQIQGEPLDVIPMNVSTKFDNVTAQDYGMAIFKYKRGISFAKACSNEAGGFLRRQFVICGSKGTIEINPIEKYIQGSKDRKDMVSLFKEVPMEQGWHTEYEFKKTEAYNRYDDMMRHYAELVRGEKENEFTK